MRPAIKIGLYTQSPIEMSLWKVILQTHGYKIIASDDVVTAMRSAETDDLRCFLIIRTANSDDSYQMSMRIRRIKSDIRPRVIFLDRLATCFDVNVDSFFAGKKVTTFQILEVIEMWQGRPRGPKRLSITAVRAMEASCQALGLKQQLDQDGRELKR